jgi:hypothetical protein
MRIPPLLLATFTALACSAGTGSRANRPAEVVRPAADSLPLRSSEADSVSGDTLPPGPAAGDLTGAWTTGSTNEPAVREIELRPSCTHSPGYWVVQQSGDTVRAWMNPEQYAQGVRSQTLRRPTMAEGRLRGTELVMTDGTSRYRLRYDPASDHLRGTLNGAPFWAVRLRITRPQDCLAVP